MSAAFTMQLRTAGPALELGSGQGAIAFRVEAAELWDALRVVAHPSTTVAELKQQAVATLLPSADFADDFVLKLRGWELLDHSATLADAGVVDGSILLLARRRRRPVR